MFQAPRQLFHRHSSTPVTPSTRTADSQAKAEDARHRADRHPAMRGLDVSPVHGRHCICGRCAHTDDAA